jgi:hypothetical protein
MIILHFVISAFIMDNKHPSVIKTIKAKIFDEFYGTIREISLDLILIRTYFPTVGRYGKNLTK